MALNVATNFGTEADLARDLASVGYKAKEVEAKPEPAPPTEDKTSVQPAEAGGATEPHTPAGNESAAPSEGAEDKTQEPQAAAPAAASPTPEHQEPTTSRSKFKAEKEKLREQISRYKDDLDLERGSKAKIQAKVEELEAKLAELTKPAAPTAGPVRPTRPTRASVEFDDERWESAMTEYEQKLDAYNAAIREQERQADRHAWEQQQTQQRAQEQAAKDQADFNARRDSSMAEIEDFHDVIEALGDAPIEFPGDGVMQATIEKAQNPAELIYYFALDHLEQGGKEMARIAAMHPVLQVSELTRLHDRLVSERAAKRTPPPAAVAGTPVVQAPPAQTAPPPKPETPVPVRHVTKPAGEPIQPVGSRSAGATVPSLEKLAENPSPREYLLARARGAK